jgi:CRP-like cAMP-binding protein/Na+/melibiose symporter-like transporter
MLGAVTAALKARLRESARSFGQVFGNRQIRRLEIAWSASIIGHWAYGVALAVFAYRDGGAAAVGLVGLIRFIPPAFAAPVAAMLADRYSRKRVMVAANLLRGIALAALTAASVAGLPVAVIYVLAGVVSVAFSAVRPAQAALLPSLARSPTELTAANVVTSTIESVGIFGGPALGGVLLAFTSEDVVFAFSAGAFLFAAAMVARIPAEAKPEPKERGGAAREAFAGFRTIATEPDLRVLVALFSAQTLVAGALNVLIVVSALDLLDLGEQGVGYLTSAIGIGGLFGAFVAIILVGRQRLASDFLIGLLLWGIPIALIGLFPDTIPALLLLAIVGLGNTLVDVSAFTLLQRAVSDDVLARVFGALQSLMVGTIGLGSILAPLLIELVGSRGALLATGALLPILAALLWRRLVALDERSVAPTRELELLRGIEIFHPLPAPVLEGLAGAMVPMHVEAGREIVREGEAGDRFYVIESGEVEVLGEGRVINEEGPGEYFGEIALLREVPRTATVRAKTDVELRALERDDFIAAVTGHAESAEAADSVIATRLSSLRPGLASV